MRFACLSALLKALLLLWLPGLGRSQPYAFTLGNKTHGWVERLSLQPRAFLLHGFLSTDEADYIIQTALPELQRSEVVGPDGKEMLDDIRTSLGAFLLKDRDPVLKVIEDRVAAATHLPNANHEDLQVLRYEKGQTYRDHYDINDSPERLAQMKASGQLGGMRSATLLMYLSDVQEGGETAFPYGRWIDAGKQASPPYSECAARGTAVKPRKGDAVLFFSLKPDGKKKDIYSFHAGCPVIRGVKFSATKWIHVEEFGQADVSDPPAEGCADSRPECKTWAADGECERNKGYMVGPRGHCRLSCGECQPEP
ncbi:hypothetical protein ABPG75_004857 [Micractinium tetrahymenae]